MHAKVSRWHSLKTQATVFTLTLFVLGIWSLSFIANRMLREDMQRVLGAQQFSTASVLAENIGSALTDRLDALQRIARELDGPLMGQPHALQARLEQQPLLQKLFNGGTYITGIDATAVASFPASAHRTGLNFMEQDDVATALKEGKVAIGRPGSGSALKPHLFGITVPIFDTDGAVIGALVGVTTLEQPNFLDIVTRHPQGASGGYAVLVDRGSRLVVTASYERLVMKAYSEPGVQPLLDRFFQGYEGYGIIINALGQEVLASAKGIPGSGWYVSVGLPVEEAFAPLFDLQQRLLLATLILTLLTGVPTWWVLRRQLSPLVHTADAMVALAESNQLAQLLPVTRQDEVGYLVDAFNRILERWRQREAQLKDSRQNLAVLMENLSCGVVVHGPDTSILFSNAMAATLLGLSRDQMLGKAAIDPDWRFLQDDGTPMLVPDYPVNRVLTSGAILHNYVVGIPHPGRADSLEMTWVLCSAYPVRGDDGAIVQVVVTFTDITQRKHAEAALITSEERWKFAIEGAGDGLWDWNIQTGKAFYSPRYKAILGFAEDDIGDSAEEWSKRLHPEDAPGVFATLQPYMEGKPGSASVEFRMQCKDGGWRWVLGRGIVVARDGDGRPLRMIGTNSDISERKEYERTLKHIAHFDALTNLANRILLADRLQQAMAQAQRRHQQLAVVYLDLDGFKLINDRYGHQVGDQVLINLALRMKEALREGDTLARLGGDEFVAVLIDLDDASDSTPLLARLLAAAAQPVAVKDWSLQVSASLGVTFYPQKQDLDADQLLRQADQAMYQAKLAGKNRYHVFDADQDSYMRLQHESLERIRPALAEGEFVLYYQPKVNMRSGTVIGVEALIRWQHPEKGLLAPSAFLPLIENHPLAVDVGEWVINTALTQMQQWQAVGLDLPVSVNIGARQLQQGNFVTQLRAILAAHPRIRPDCLELEVLETSALADMAQVAQVIDDCAQFGVKFALDDFGTGYSSLIYLKRLHVTLLKIDQSFVRGMLDDPDDLAILHGVIGLAAAFKRQVIAEGVETVAHGTLLLQLGCDLAQGYGIARPMPADSVPAWVATWPSDAAWRALAQTGVPCSGTW
jgi:diguanylate cyclase (GGDEF)-like protein/PAS domain S-box-containing protein